MVQLFARLWIKDYKQFSSPTVKQQYAKLCSVIGIVINIALFSLKFLCGIISGSTAIVADGFNNLADVITTALSFLGFIMAGIGAGKHHPFGHGRYEWLMSIFSSVAVMAMGITLAKSSIQSIKSPEAVNFNILVCIILLCSIAAKFYMFLYNKRIGKAINSSAMRATATDSVSDLLSTTAILIALLVETITGWKIDGWCGLLVSIFIVFSGFKSVAETMERILGQAADEEVVTRIKEMAKEYPLISEVNDLIIHDYGLGHIVISMHIFGTKEVERQALNDIAHEIEYALYLEMDCNTTIQVDILDNSPHTSNIITQSVNYVFQDLKIDAQLQNFRAVTAGTHIDVTLIIAFSRRLQKREQEIRRALEQIFSSLNQPYRITVRFVIAAIPQKIKRQSKGDYQ